MAILRYYLSTLALLLRTSRPFHVALHVSTVSHVLPRWFRHAGLAQLVSARRFCSTDLASHVLIRRLVSPRTPRPQHMLPRKSRPAALPAYLALHILSRRLFEGFYPSKIYYCAFSDAFPVWQSQYIVRGNAAHFLK